MPNWRDEAIAVEEPTWRSEAISLDAQPVPDPVKEDRWIKDTLDISEQQQVPIAA